MKARRLFLLFPLLRVGLKVGAKGPDGVLAAAVCVEYVAELCNAKICSGTIDGGAGGDDG